MTYSQQTIDTVQRALDAHPCTSCGAKVKTAPRWNCEQPEWHKAIPVRSVS